MQRNSHLHQTGKRGTKEMQSKENTMIDHLLNWKLVDLIDSYEINRNNEIEDILNELINLLVRDIKECDSYDDKNN